MLKIFEVVRNEMKKKRDEKKFKINSLKNGYKNPFFPFNRKGETKGE